MTLPAGMFTHTARLYRYGDKGGPGGISYHRTADAAIARPTAVRVKICPANAGEITISDPLKLDLNGKTRQN